MYLFEKYLFTNFNQYDIIIKNIGESYEKYIANEFFIFYSFYC